MQQLGPGQERPKERTTAIASSAHHAISRRSRGRAQREDQGDHDPADVQGPQVRRVVVVVRVPREPGLPGEVGTAERKRRDLLEQARERERRVRREQVREGREAARRGRVDLGRARDLRRGDGAAEREGDPGGRRAHGRARRAPSVRASRPGRSTSARSRARRPGPRARRRGPARPRRGAATAPRPPARAATRAAAAITQGARARASPLLKNRQVETYTPERANAIAATSAAARGAPSARAQRRAPAYASTAARAKRRPNATGRGRTRNANMSGKNVPKFGLPGQGLAERRVRAEERERALPHLLDRRRLGGQVGHERVLVGHHPAARDEGHERRQQQARAAARARGARHRASDAGRSASAASSRRYTAVHHAKHPDVDQRDPGGGVADRHADRRRVGDRARIDLDGVIEHGARRGRDPGSGSPSRPGRRTARVSAAREAPPAPGAPPRAGCSAGASASAA